MDNFDDILSRLALLSIISNREDDTSSSSSIVEQYDKSIDSKWTRTNPSLYKSAPTNCYNDNKVEVALVRLDDV